MKEGNHKGFSHFEGDTEIALVNKIKRNEILEFQLLERDNLNGKLKRYIIRSQDEDTKDRLMDLL